MRSATSHRPVTTTAPAATPGTRSLKDAATLFRGGRGYLSACTMGLPTTETVAATLRDAERWARGEAS
ncbi:MAG: hypothetical protein ABWY30_00270, partial [Microterricola sp.]